MALIRLTIKSTDTEENWGFLIRDLPALCIEGPSQSLKIRGDNVPPLVEIGLTDLPKTGWGGGAKAPPVPPLETGLYSMYYVGQLAQSSGF